MYHKHLFNDKGSKKWNNRNYFNLIFYYYARPIYIKEMFMLLKNVYLYSS